jgi:Trk K+ transport system NAD-binding subunit
VLDVIDVGPAMVGHTLRELALPQRHRCTVVAMSVWDEAAGEHRRCAADLDAPLQANDRLVLLGPSEAVAALAGEGR